MSSYKTIADVFNAYGVGVFPVKDNPGRFTVSFVNSKGKRQFIDRVQVQKEDGTKSWIWSVGRELAPKEAGPADTEAAINMA